MLASIILLDQNSNANNVEIMVFESFVGPPLRRRLGGGVDDMVRNV